MLELAGTAQAPPEPEGSRLLRMAGGALRRAGGSIARQVRLSPGFRVLGQARCPVSVEGLTAPVSLLAVPGM